MMLTGSPGNPWGIPSRGDGLGLVLGNGGEGRHGAWGHLMGKGMAGTDGNPWGQ